MQLESPHIPLGISLDEGLKILESFSSEIEKRTDKEGEFYKIVFDNWECGFYERNGIVTSTCITIRQVEKLKKALIQRSIAI